MSRYLIEVNKQTYEIEVTPLEEGEKEKSEKKDSLEQCKALDTLLEVSMDEHTKAREQTSNLDNKASIFISAIIAFLAFYLPLIPTDRIIDVYRSVKVPNIVIVTIALVIMVCAALMIGVSFYMLYRAIRIRGFQTVNRDTLEETSTQAVSDTAVKRGLITHYNTILKSYDEANNEKAKALRIGLVLAIIAFILLVVTITVLMFCTGGQVQCQTI